MLRLLRTFTSASRTIENFQAQLGPGRTYNNRYRIISHLGEGQHATVWLAEDTQKPGSQVAIKVLSTLVTSIQGKDAFELDVLNRIALAAPDNNHLLHLLERFTIKADHGTHACLVTKVFATKTLKDFATKTLKDLARAAPRRKLPIQFVRQVARQLLTALAALHDDCHVTHTDIKPDNILFDAAHLDPATADAQILAGAVNVVLADMGTALPDSTPRRFPVQPVALRAPEVLLGCEWDRKIDIWNMGCLIFELLTGNQLFDPHPYESFSAEQYHFARICATLGPGDPSVLSPMFLKGKFYGTFYDTDGLAKLGAAPEPFTDVLKSYSLGDDGCTDFLTSMLRIDPHDRAPASQLVLHPWLSVL